MKLKNCVVVTKGGFSTFYEVSYQPEQMKDLICDITIANGKNGKNEVSEQPIMVRREYVEEHPDSETIISLDGVSFSKSEEVTEGTNKGLFKRFNKYRLHNVLSLKMMAFMREPSRLKSLFQPKQEEDKPAVAEEQGEKKVDENAEFYDKVLSLITVSKIETIPTCELQVRLGEFFPGINWFDRRKRTQKYLESSQILNDYDLEQFDKLKDQSNKKKQIHRKSKRTIIVQSNVGI